MSNDPLVSIALQRAVALSAEIEAQLQVTEGCRPVAALLVRARREAADAMVGLAIVDPDDPKKIRALQNLILRFDDLVRWLREMVIAGEEADAEISGSDREELIILLSGSAEGQREAERLGLIGSSNHADA